MSTGVTWMVAFYWGTFHFAESLVLLIGLLHPHYPMRCRPTISFETHQTTIDMTVVTST